MRFLWIISAVMVAAGVLLVVAALVGGASPLALVGGVLLLWSGVVKVIVLRIWKSTLSLPSTSGRAPHRAAPSSASD